MGDRIGHTLMAGLAIPMGMFCIVRDEPATSVFGMIVLAFGLFNLVAALKPRDDR